MTNNLSVTPSQASVMLDFFTGQRVEHISSHAEVFKKLDDIDSMIEKLKEIINSGGRKYPREGSWNDKIKYILSSEPFPMLTRDIVEAIAQMEGVTTGSEKWKEIYKGVAPSLSAGEKWYMKSETVTGKTGYSLKE